jgi:acid phosphatase (class A)
MKRQNWNSTPSWTLVAMAFFLLFAGCAGVQKTPGKPLALEERGGYLPGYLALTPEALPNSLELIPPPPATGSTAFLLDQEVYRTTRVFRGTPRWELATLDAELRFPAAAGTFSCAINAPITEKDTPFLYQLLRRSLSDAGLATYNAKNAYKRTRPFDLNKETSCTPDIEKRVAMDPSYPSGHSSIGWAWALVLAEVDPENANAILARGRAFSESRVVCGVHWQSDIVEGRHIGASAVARIHADPTFRADIEAARAELAAVRAKGLQPTRDCRAEAAALNFQSPPAK